MDDGFAKDIIDRLVIHIKIILEKFNKELEKMYDDAISIDAPNGNSKASKRLNNALRSHRKDLEVLDDRYRLTIDKLVELNKHKKEFRNRIN